MRYTPVIAWCLLVSPGVGLCAAPARAVEYYEGLAYAKKSGELLYRESHWIQSDGRRLVLYACPGGQPFARKTVGSAAVSPDFEFIDARAGYREGVRTRDGVREVFTQASASAAEQSKPLPARADQVIDAGFDSYVRQQWDALARPNAQRIAFLVPSRLQAMDFQLRPLPSGGDTRRYKLALDAWYGGVVPHIEVTYSAADRRLLKFEGIGNIRDAAGKYQAVRIEFPSGKRGLATAADVGAAARASLVARCGRS